MTTSTWYNSDGSTDVAILRYAPASGPGGSYIKGTVTRHVEGDFTFHPFSGGCPVPCARPEKKKTSQKRG